MSLPRHSYFKKKKTESQYIHGKYKYTRTLTFRIFCAAHGQSPCPFWQSPGCCCRHARGADGSARVAYRQALTSLHIYWVSFAPMVGLFCPYGRSLLTRVWSAQCGACSRSLQTTPASSLRMRVLNRNGMPLIVGLFCLGIRSLLAMY